MLKQAMHHSGYCHFDSRQVKSQHRASNALTIGQGDKVNSHHGDSKVGRIKGKTVQVQFCYEYKRVHRPKGPEGDDQGEGCQKAWSKGLDEDK